jgi:hypothetical protein
MPYRADKIPHSKGTALVQDNLFKSLIDCHFDIRRNKSLIDCHPDDRRDLEALRIQDPSYRRDDKKKNSRSLLSSG